MSGDLCPCCVRRLSETVTALGEPGYFNDWAGRTEKLTELSFARRVIDAATARLEADDLARREADDFARRVLTDIEHLPGPEDPG